MKVLVLAKLVDTLISSAKVCIKVCIKESPVYCKVGNFRENFIFANSIKRRICDVKNPQLDHDLPSLVNDRMVLERICEVSQK